MKKKTALFMMAALLVLGQFSFPQDKLVLTLDDSVRLALAQNPYHLATGERVDAAYSGLRQAASQFFPSLDAQGLYTLDEKVFELEFPSFIPGQPPRRVKVDFTRDYQFALSLTLPLFTGGRLTSGFRQAKYNLESAKEAVRQSEHITVFNTKRAFYGYLLAKEFVDVAREAVEVAEKHLRNVKNMYEVGMASKFDLLRSEVQVANLKPNLIKARNNLQIAELSVKTLLGVDLSTPVDIRGELVYEPFEPDLEACISTALTCRPEILQLRYQKRMAVEALRISRAAYMPTVAVSGTYNFWADRFNFQKNNWQDFYSVNLVLTVPVFNGFATSAQVARAQAGIRELELTEKGLEEAIRFEVRQAVLKLQEAKQSLLSQERNVEQAKESLRIAELNFSEGLATTLDVSSAQAAYSQAKTN